LDAVLYPKVLVVVATREEEPALAGPIPSFIFALFRV
jgi:hypothetical protein